MALDPIVQNEIRTQITPQLQPIKSGFDLEPVAIDASVMRKLFVVLAKINANTAQMRQNSSGSFQANIEKARRLMNEILSNGNKQAGVHGLTSVLIIGLGAAAAKNGIDVTSGVTLADKLGNGGVKTLEASGTFMGSEKQIVDQQVSKTSDANQRVMAFFKQAFELVRGYMDQQHQQKVRGG